MRKLAFQLVIAAVLFIVATSVPAQERIIPSEAARYAGKKATVCGQVTSTNYAEDSKGRPTYLNLDRAYPNQKFNAVIPGENRDKFSKPPEINYAGKKICVTGTINVFRGVAEIVVRDPSQITRGE
jgi:DNA/RNA endonuclease YhcR with UshA esterase domain